MKEINEGEFASIFPDIALFLDKMVNGDKYKKAIRGYLNWRRTNPSQGLRGITKFAKMTGLRAKDLDIVLHKLIKQGKLPKHLAIHENERKDSEIMMAEKKKFKDIRKDDPCWDGYKQVGMKKKNGKEVPNCVPEETEITEMKLPISDEMFKSLKKGDKIKINFDSSIKKGNENTYVVKSKSKSAKYNLEKIALKNVANPVAQASYLYNKQGKVTMAQGDMAVTMNSVVKEAVDEGANMDRAKDQAARIRARVRKEIDGLKDRARSADASSKNRSTRPRPLKSEEVDLTEDSQAALQTKAEKSGISYSILKKVYDRGLAAWKTGHRPGATQQQWGYARVNSFITGGKTRTTADADLWKQHKGI